MKQNKAKVDSNGLDIKSTAHRLRTYAMVERQCIKLLAGWFLAAPAYEMKYTLGHHLWDHAEHVSWLRERLRELRGGNPDASVAPALRRVMSEALHAPTTEDMLRGLYGVVKRSLLEAYREHLEHADLVANAAETRLLRRIIPELEAHLAWYDALELERGAFLWQDYIAGLLAAAGGIMEEGGETKAPQSLSGHRFERPKQIHFDARIHRGELTPYEVRQSSSPQEATIEQFKVFFNEFYAAAILASALYDAFEDGHPWGFYHDFCHQFWDEVRHSEFGAVRLKELGRQPEVCNPVLFEQVEALPVLHRICYLTLGLEVHFMARKQPRVQEYEANGDYRSQLFADQDWSDEINHVRYGKRWVKYLLEDDYRTVDDIQQEIREHLERVSGVSQSAISTPF